MNSDKMWQKKDDDNDDDDDNNDEKDEKDRATGQTRAGIKKFSYHGL